MIKVIAILAATAILTGCASMRPDIERQSNADLCVKYLAYPANIWRADRLNELVKRGEDCSRYAPLAAAQVQADASMNAAAIQLLSQPAIYQQPQQRTVCSTDKFGNSLRTVCQ